MSRARDSLELKSRNISARLDGDLYERFNAALIREQARIGQRLYASSVLLPAIKAFVERSEQAG